MNEVCYIVGQPLHLSISYKILMAMPANASLPAHMQVLAAADVTNTSKLAQHQLQYHAMLLQYRFRVEDFQHESEAHP